VKWHSLFCPARVNNISVSQKTRENARRRRNAVFSSKWIMNIFIGYYKIYYPFKEENDSWMKFKWILAIYEFTNEIYVESVIQEDVKRCWFFGFQNIMRYLFNPQILINNSIFQMLLLDYFRLTSMHGKYAWIMGILTKICVMLMH